MAWKLNKSLSEQISLENTIKQDQMSDLATFTVCSLLQHFIMLSRMILTFFRSRTTGNVYNLLTFNGNWKTFEGLL